MKTIETKNSDTSSRLILESQIRSQPGHQNFVPCLINIYILGSVSSHERHIVRYEYHFLQGGEGGNSN